MGINKKQLESICFNARWKLTESDKYIIRIIWNRYNKLYIQQQKGKLKSGEYATRRRNYLNLIDDILGLYSIPHPAFSENPDFNINNVKLCTYCNGSGFENNCQQ